METDKKRTELERLKKTDANAESRAEWLWSCYRRHDTFGSKQALLGLLSIVERSVDKNVERPDPQKLLRIMKETDIYAGTHLAALPIIAEMGNYTGFWNRLEVILATARDTVAKRSIPAQVLLRQEGVDHWAV